jgi:carbon-monoxide dehydrogenase medium subunit
LIDAQAIIWARGKIRPVPVAGLAISSFTTLLQRDELIRSIRIPKLTAGARWGFYKFSQKAGEFAHAIGGILYDPARSAFRAVIGAIETAPIVIADATSLFEGGFGPDLAERFDQEAVLQLLDEKNVKDPYIRSLARVALQRAAKQACAS